MCGAINPTKEMTPVIETMEATIQVVNKRTMILNALALSPKYLAFSSPQ